MQKLMDTVDQLMDGPIKVHLLTYSAQLTHQSRHGQCCAPPLSLCGPNFLISDPFRSSWALKA